MKKVIALSCSPSHGYNSDTMLDTFIEGIKQNPEVEVEKIYLDEIPMAFYDYQHKLVNPEEEPKLAELCEKIKNINGLVIATPTYNFNVPARLKNFIDRIGFIALDYKNTNLLGQPIPKLGYLKTFFLVSGGTPNWAQKLLFSIFPPFWLSVAFKYYGAKLGGSIFGGNLKAYKKASDDHRLIFKCRKAGYNYSIKL